MGEVNIPGLLGILVFYLAILAVGLWAAKKRKSNEEESMLAGRSLGIYVGSFTMTATWVGGGYINGTAEAVYAEGKGLVWAQAPWGYTTSLVLGGLFFAKIMRMREYMTMLDPFTRKYGPRFGGVCFIPALIGEVFWSASILAALGSTVSVVVGLDRFTSVITSAAIAVAYTLVGGLYSVAYTDILQLICIFIGLWLSIPFIMTNPAVGDISDHKEWIGEWEPAKAGLWLDYGMHLIFGGIPWQVYFQRVLACRTPKVAQGLSFTAAIGCVIFTIPSIIIGAAGKVTDWSKTSFYTGPVNATNVTVEFDQSLILPMALQYLTPTAVSFIGLGAVSAAVMSSSDSSVLSASTMFSHNVYKLVFRPQALSREMYWVLRIAIIGVGAIATTMALTVKSIYVLFVLCSDIVYVILFPQLLCVIYMDKIVNTYGAVSGYIVGLSLRILGGEPNVGIQPTIIFPWYNETDGQLFPYRTLSMASGLFAIIVVSQLLQILFNRGIVPMKYDFFHC
ncbi:predicted protein, partial [Nematostella vectensis]